ncbi:MAG: biopolymer transporter ExbD [Prevotellaceae bacterium]|jgi:biopolymer transport protein ExbD|nr:biopolymer transporter ExbD [Prevotellaceae bacterium]
MALKRRIKVSPDFSMSSMTDIIFLLLLFFMITLTVVHTQVTNEIKVALPQSNPTEGKEKAIVRIVIDKDNNIYIAKNDEREKPVALEQVESFLQQIDKTNDMYVALYADETLPYGEVVKMLDIANRNAFKLVLATKPFEK